MKKHIYIKALKSADQTVFCVDDAQKYYYEPLFRRRCPFSSGAQVKRSIMTHFLSSLGVDESPKVFNLKVGDGDKRDGNGEVWNTCDPRDIDQLIGGYMTAKAKGQAIKRRSPLSISAMRPLHPLLSGMKDDNVSFDRSNTKNSVVQFVNKKGEILDPDDIYSKNKESAPMTARTFIPDGIKTATGYFVYEVAIDIEKLFVVLDTDIDPEVSKEVLAELRAEGWIPVETFNGKGLMMPDSDKRDRILDALIDAILNFRITSNQSRTFSPMDAIAVGVAEEARNVSYAIRSRLMDEDADNPKAKIVLDENTPANLYMTPLVEQISSKHEGAYDAVQKAKYDIKYKVLEAIESIKKKEKMPV